MMMTVNQRIEALREVMKREHLAAFIFPSTDPHQGEYRLGWYGCGYDDFGCFVD